MYATTGFPHHLNWSSFELAEAVPRRLSELYHFDARFDARFDAPEGVASANGDVNHRRITRQYVPASALPDMFRVD